MSANFRLQRTAAASRGFLAIARLLVFLFLVTTTTAAAAAAAAIPGLLGHCSQMRFASSRPTNSVLHSTGAFLSRDYNCDSTTIRLQYDYDVIDVVAEGSLYHNCDSTIRYDYDTTIPRVHDAFDYDGSDRNHDSTAIRLRRIARLLPFDGSKKINMTIFRRSRVVVVS